MRTRALYLLACITGIIACDDLEQPTSNPFVVEAFITADQQVNDIKIKAAGDLNDEEIPDLPIDHVTIRLLSDTDDVLLSYDDRTGKYFLDGEDFNINSNDSYSIIIEANGTEATASTVVPEAPTGLELSRGALIIPTLTLNFGLRQQIQELFNEEVITLTWTAIPERSYFVVIEHLEEELDPILLQEIPEESLELIGSFRFISAPSEIASFDIIGIALETYGRHVAKVYTVNQEYVDLFNSATQDSRDLNEPPSNVSNALGIFTAFAVDSVEFLVQRN